jgi:anthranilate phosphoribosyltransferase
VLKTLTQQLAERQDLTDANVTFAVTALTSPEVTPVTKAEFLTALAQKGETVAEIAAFARELRDKSIAPPLNAETRARQILDVCGTGGDRLNTFNISTTVALIASAAGVTVAKHGNRAITSQAGSADVLEALGIRVDLEPDEAARALCEHQFAFFFAPKYHPAFREIAPARRLCAERRQRTIFNFLGPLLNPVRPATQMIGVPRPELCQPVAQVLQLLGTRRGMVVSGEVPLDGAIAHLDELSTLGDNCVAEFYHERGFSVSTLSPRAFPLQPAVLVQLVGGDREMNADIVRELLRGKERGPKRDAILLNAAGALFVAEKAASLTEGWELAEELVDSGKAMAKLEELAAVWPHRGYAV